MFESAELGHKISASTYKRRLPGLRKALLQVQYALAQSRKFPVILVIGGVDGAGKGETVNLLNEWLDPRHINTHAFGPPSEEEAERPTMWRFWRTLPPTGEMAIYFGSWYTEPISRHTRGKIKQTGLDHALDEVVRFEKMLIDEGALVIKFWFHLSKQKQKIRFRQLQQDPKTSWRVTKQDLQHTKCYDRFRKTADHVLRQTSTAGAPWIVIEGFDANYRHLTAANHLLQAISKRLQSEKAEPVMPAAPPLLEPLDRLQILSTLDLTLTLGNREYRGELAHYQARLSKLTRKDGFRHINPVIVFEGPDAAGKGGSIRRLTAAVDARFYTIVTTAAPSEEERAQPYLWRFWRHLPRKGRLLIFDRSWYGRVLVERVEGFCSEYDWMRAYNEINDFEQQLLDNDGLLIKFWLEISEEEQLARFKARANIPYKRYKLTADDWRNRAQWDHYQLAASQMVERTSTGSAPWTLVEANDKRHARIKILRSVCQALSAKLD